jgi:type IV secretion system protein VirD4
MSTLKRWLLVLGIFVFLVFGIRYYNMNPYEHSTIHKMILYLILLGIVIWAYKKTKKLKQSILQKDIEHGSAEWATFEQLQAAGVLLGNEQNHNYDNGATWFAGNFRTANHYHCLTVAPSRSGKGASVIIPNLLSKPVCSLVVTDPKGELAFITARFQANSGQKVYIIDPWNLQETNGSVHGIKPSGFNPFDFIKMEENKLIDNCTQIAALLVPVNPLAKDPYWDDAARNLIKLCMLHIVTAMPESEHHFWTLYKMLRPHGEEWARMLVEMEYNDAFDGLISRQSAEYSMPPTESPLRSVISTAQNATTIFESPELRASLLKSDFNPMDLSNGDCTVYIVIPYEYLESHARWLRMLVGICIRAATVKINKRVKFILDEFGVLGKMEEIAKGFQFLAGKNICLWPFIQDLGTLKQIYGEEGMNKFVANASVLQFFGTNDPFTANYISELLGEATITQKTESYQSGQNGGSSTTYNKMARKLMTPEEIMKDEGTIIFHSNLKTHMPKYFYYNTFFVDRADKPPFMPTTTLKDPAVYTPLKEQKLSNISFLRIALRVIFK